MRKDILIQYFTVTLVVLITTFVFWLPFLLRTTSWFGLTIPNSNFLYIYRHYDGLLYVVASKTMYIPSLIDKFPLAVVLPVKYYAAHLPLYPLFIGLFAPFFNYAKSMIFVNILSTIGLTLFFYYLVSRFKLTKRPMILTFVFLMLPRFLIIRSIGAPESLFIFLILLSLFFFEKKNYLLAGLFGGFATMTKTPGVLLLLAYLLVILERAGIFRVISNEVRNLVPIKSGRNYASPDFSFASLPRNDVKREKFNWRFLYLLLIPSGLLLVFSFYQIQYDDFFAYFHSGDNIHLATPFSAFNSQNRWIGNAWLEDVLFYFFLYLMAVINLKHIKYRSFFYFGLVFFIATSLVQHRDIGRYSLPLWPLACIALEKLFTSKKFLFALVILLPAIYLYSWNFSLQNVMPVTEWNLFFSK